MKIYQYNVSEGNMHYYFINKKDECLHILYFYEHFSNSVKTEFYSKNPFDLPKFEQITIKDVPNTVIRTLTFINLNS